MEASVHHSCVIKKYDSVSHNDKKHSHNYLDLVSYYIEMLSQNSDSLSHSNEKLSHNIVDVRLLNS